MRMTGAELVQKVSNSRADKIADAVIRNEETSDAPGAADLAPTPIFETNGKFFFWDETWTVAKGPYDTREEAQAKLQEYAESLG